MIIACVLGGILGAFVSVLTGLWCGIGLPGLIALHVLGGTISFVVSLAVAMAVQQNTEAASRAS
ncbi:MAG: hypothetical protein KKB02_15470 [Alphaproteobacteria bacterium]|nr:hypothetical protein [Alphaproteobacteria bacterium]